MAQERPAPDGSPPVPPYLTGEDKRSVILRAAHKLFLRDGYSVTSMDAVTREAGVSKATVYAHFEGKAKLFEELIRLGSETGLKASTPLTRRGGDPRDELVAFFEPLLTLIFRGGYAWSRLLIAEAQRHPENAGLFYRCTIERVGQAVEGYLADLAREGLLAERDAHLAADALLAVVLLGPLHRALLLGPQAVDFRASLRFGIDLLLGPHNPGGDAVSPPKTV